MLLRFEADDVIAITQPAHSWVSGQIARAWSRDPVEPWEEVCLAAALHDIGWMPWESEPSLNPETGLPYSFRELQTETHIDIWSQAGAFALTLGRYPALLVSLHGTGLYERFGPGPDAPKDIRSAVDSFMDREYAFQRQLINSMRAEPRYAEYVSPDAMERNRKLISIWDAMSLHLCGGFEGSQSVGDGLSMTQASNDGSQVTVDPWPFAKDRLRVVVQGRRLTGRFTEERAMQDALDHTDWVTLEIDLTQS